MEQATTHLRDVTNNSFGDNARINQVDIHNYAPRQADPCLADLRITDPRDDKTRIEETKGNLLRDSYCWILDHADFKMWRNDPQCRLLWIKGDPGKGKTMLLCGVINELEKLATCHLSYFFCQATEPQLRSATAVLRGIIYTIIVQQPLLISHVRERYISAGKELFEDRNAWTALSKILKAILNDLILKEVVLVIDALDECTEELPRLLNLIKEISSSSSSRAKWIVSSRNWLDIEKELKSSKQKISLCLELNEGSISAAVQSYIDYKVDLLAQKNNYSEAIPEIIKRYLISNANDTFLWVALTCQNISNIGSRKVLKKLTSYPPGLDSLYKRMLDQIFNLDDDDDASLCKQVLATVSTVYRPVTLHELHSLIGSPEEFLEDMSTFEEIIHLCGSFLTIRSDTIYFIHQSAKDHLTTDGVWSTISPFSPKEMHYTLFSQSLQSMNNTLRRDIYCLGTPGYHIDQIQQHNPDPLIAVRYSCTSWINHLCDYNGDKIEDAVQDRGLITIFIRHHFLHWLEALSLLRSMPEGVLSIVRLTDLLVEHIPQSQILSLVQDARRFAFRNKWMIESAPLQVYVSALIFSPLQSKIRKIYKDDEPSWVNLKPTVETGWDACLQVLEGHRGFVNSVVFSPNSQLLASASNDRTIRVWDTNSGACLQTLHGHNDTISSVTFSPNGRQLASGSSDTTVKMWDINSGACLQTLKHFNFSINSIAFSSDNQLLAVVPGFTKVEVWDANLGACLQTLESHIISVTFSPKGQLLASCSTDGTVSIWDAKLGTRLQKLDNNGPVTRNNSVESRLGVANSAAFSPNGQLLASGFYNSIVKVWDVNANTCLHILEGHNKAVLSVAFSPNCQWLASGSVDKTIKIWDIHSGTCLQTLNSHDVVNSVTFSPNRRWLASGSNDKALRVWDIDAKTWPQTLDRYDNSISSITISPNGQSIASGSVGGIVKVWDAKAGTCLLTLEHDDFIRSVVFSPNGQLLAAGSMKSIIVWDAHSGDVLKLTTWEHALTFNITDDVRIIYKDNVSFTRTAPEVLSQGTSFQYGISDDKTWIIKDKKPLIWLPPEYRPNVSAVFGDTIAIGCISLGRVLILRFSIY
ncbi:quinon protein alcohol dehydrogenase-like superfamily [Trichoderma barbatum]